MRRLLLVLAIAACNSQTTTEQMCDRMQSCNLLAAGYSADECEQDLDADASSLAQNQRDEFEFELQQCLDHPSCSGFGDCLSALLGSS
jgi:hypothetical protein